MKYKKIVITKFFIPKNYRKHGSAFLMFGSETFMNNIIGIEFGNTIFRDRLQDKINTT